MICTMLTADVRQSSFAQSYKKSPFSAILNQNPGIRQQPNRSTAVASFWREFSAVCRARSESRTGTQRRERAENSRQSPP